MKPRRDNGAVLVSPTMSDVSIGSALIVFFSLDGGRIQQAIASEHKSRGRVDFTRLGCGPSLPWRGQKTRPPAEYNALRPCHAPGIKIGLHRPEAAACLRIMPVSVKQFTFGSKKLQAPVLQPVFDHARQFQQ